MTKSIISLLPAAVGEFLSDTLGGFYDLLAVALDIIFIVIITKIVIAIVTGVINHIFEKNIER